MKVAFLASRSVHTIKWINILASYGIEVHWITQDTKHEQNNVVDEKVTIHQLSCHNKAGYYLNVFELRHLLKQIKPDILNAHNASGYGTLARLSQFHPYLLNAWGSDVYDMKNRQFEMMVKKNLLAADELASTSAGMAERMRELINDSQKKIIITPFGVNLDLYDRNKTQHKTGGTFVIGIVKTLSPKYGISTLLKAVSIVNIRYRSETGWDNLEFRIYGDGIQRNELEELSSQLQLDGVVSFKGRIPNSKVPAALSQLDLFVLGSESESFGVSAVEAMAMGLPVIATNVTGFREVIEDGVSGILTDKRDPDRFAERILKLMYDDNKRLILGENARQRVEDLFDLRNNAETMISAYEELIAR